MHVVITTSQSIFQLKMSGSLFRSISFFTSNLLTRKNIHSIDFHEKSGSFSLTKFINSISPTEEKERFYAIDFPIQTIYHAKHNIRGKRKKLVHLASQINRMPLNEALVQMKFSDKRLSQDIHQALLEAKQKAIEVGNIINEDLLWIEHSFVGKGDCFVYPVKKGKGMFRRGILAHSHYFVVLKEGEPLDKNIRRKNFTDVSRALMIENSEQNTM